MNPILEEIYSTILPSMPYLIGAYVLMLVAVLVYVFLIASGMSRAEKTLQLLEESVEDPTRD